MINLVKLAINLAGRRGVMLTVVSQGMDNQAMASPGMRRQKNPIDTPSPNSTVNKNKGDGSLCAQENRPLLILLYQGIACFLKLPPYNKY